MAVVTGLNSSLLNYLSTQGLDLSTTHGKASATGTKATTPAVPQAALQRAAGTAKNATAVQALETAQKKLATDLRAAMDKAGVKLSGPIDIAVKSDGSVAYTGSDDDQAAMKTFLKSEPAFATRIAEQARDALKLSATIQQSAAISQAAKLAKSAGGVMSLYTSLMQQSTATSVVFSLSSNASSLTYPGSLAAHA